jgi:hypothetical protein
MDHKVCCPGCQASHVVGEIVDLAGEDVLLVNGIMVRALHGVCAKCGQEFHWSMNDRILSKIQKRLRDLEYQAGMVNRPREGRHGEV